MTFYTIIIMLKLTYFKAFIYQLGKFWGAPPLLSNEASATALYLYFDLYFNTALRKK